MNISIGRSKSVKFSWITNGHILNNSLTINSNIKNVVPLKDVPGLDSPNL